MVPPTRRVPKSVEDLLRPGGGMRVIGHRGFSGIAPENTMEAFARALDLPCDMIELDVTLSRDRIPVVLHDADLDRTTDGQGAAREKTFEELRALDAGAWFGPEFRGQRIPSLAEVLDLVRSRSALVNIEIKKEAYEDVERDGIVEAVVSSVRDRDMSGSVLVSSFEPLALERARVVGPEIARAGLWDEKPETDRSIAPLAEEHAVRSFNLPLHAVDEDIVTRIHQAGCAVLVYTVNEREDMIRMRDLNVDGLFTDRPDRLLNLLSGS